jgi:hypothetical protein
MPAVNQRIPNFLGGVSQQPDFIKFPGQLRTCHNALPDVTFGLVKRPAGEYVGKLADAEDGGQWFDIIRDDDNKFIVQITSGSNPEIIVWDLSDGSKKTVNVANGANLNYLTRTTGSTKPYGLLTINDYTFIANPDKTVTKARTTPSFQSHYGFVTVDSVAYNSEYVVSLGNSTLASSTKFRAESLTVVKAGTSSNTWEQNSDTAQYTGQTQFFSTATGSNGVKGTVTVNAQIIQTNTPAAGTDPTYKTRYTAQVVLQDTGDDVTNGTTITVAVGGQNYTVTISAVSSYQSYADSNAAVYRTPRNANKGQITVDSVLGSLKTAIEAKYSTVTATPTGNGLFLSATAAFNGITVRGGVAGDGMHAFTETVQDVSRLPNFCKDGYLVKVSNTENAQEDDYYVEFVADDGNIGSGVWEETVKPGIDAGFNYSNMPHALVNNLNGTFTFTTLDPTNEPDNHWVDRKVGDELTNPMPTFVDKKISQLFFYRNRLGLIADEQVVMSQPADYFNFFVESALTVSDADPIDLATSDTKPALINHALPVQKGVMLFSENAQFMLFTDSEQFSPKTAQVKKVAAYECSAEVSPVDLGTSIMFVSNSSSYAKAFELVIGSELSAPKVIEQTRVIPEFVPNDINEVASSTQAGIVTYAKTGTDTLYHYKYYSAGERRDQSAWYTWGLEGNLSHSLYTSGNYFAVTKQGTQYILCRHELVTDASSDRSYVIGSGTVGSPLSIARKFEALLDNMFIPASNNKAVSGGNTTITLPYTVQGGTSNLKMVVLSGTDKGYVTAPDSVSGSTATFNNIDVSSANVAVGYAYTMEAQLPSYYYRIQEGQYDINGDLRINRLNFELGVSGPLEFHLEADQHATYVQYESGIVASANATNSIPSALYKSVKVPIYKKNTKYTLTVKVPDPFTTTIVSASWDGRYDTKRHIRR